ncbi:pectinesterase 4-like [Asparagus officinalis]|uniref:pectinesterase 4-like n=1 Tax=Asparagus officinalis TaxID=4686 RepID=UPI00098E3261|nr:pectinesterase 4-like [Asparagus officinalis]
MGSANNAGLKPDIVVAQDGSGNFKTIQEAVSSVPKKNPSRVVIYVKAGTYKEKVKVEASNIFMYGDGPRKSMVTWNDNVAHGGGISTSLSYTFGVFGKGFVAKAMGFMNDAGPDGHRRGPACWSGDALGLLQLPPSTVPGHALLQGKPPVLQQLRHLRHHRLHVRQRACIVQNSLIVVRRPMDNQFNT